MSGCPEIFFPLSLLSVAELKENQCGRNGKRAKSKERPPKDEVGATGRPGKAGSQGFKIFDLRILDKL